VRQLATGRCGQDRGAAAAQGGSGISEMAQRARDADIGVTNMPLVVG
jgi:hypothetical protein